MYADKITDSMQRTMDETDRRRLKQINYNEEHQIVPTALRKSHEAIMGQSSVVKIRSSQDYYVEKEDVDVAADPVVSYMSKDDLSKLLNTTRKKMEAAAREMDFMEAARLRDEMFSLEKLVREKVS